MQLERQVGKGVRAGTEWTPPMPLERGLGRILASARRAAGISQMELAFRLNVSQRHVSYVERDRAGPSRNLIRQWAEETQCPPWVLNSALLQAGFAPVMDCEADATDLPPGLVDLLARHEPNPAHIFDADWRIVAANDAAIWLCHVLMPDLMDGRGDVVGLDMLEACGLRNGLLSRMVDPKEFAANLLSQLRAEATVRGGLSGRIADLERKLTSWLGHIGRPTRNTESTLMELSFATELGDLRFSTAQGAFGLVGDGLSGAFRVELWFPSNASTKEVISNRTA